MKSSAPTFDVNVNPDGFVVDLNSLYAHLATLHDRRHARGVRYALVTVLVFTVLAKLAGQDRLLGIAEWVKYRIAALTEALHLQKPRAPHNSTYSRILGYAVDIHEFEQVISQFFAAQPQAGQSVVINLDGKTLRGTIPAGQTQGLHLLAAFLPCEGWVLLQVEVDGKENEIKAAPRLLKCLDLRDKIVTGDALLAQRDLSIQIVEAGGDYVWTVKDNQAQLRQDIETLFEPERCVKGFSPAVKDFRTAETIEKGHGRIERRTITVSSELRGYLDWPYAEQVFKLERHFRRVKDGKITHEVAYGITSLTAHKASPERLLELSRMHWQIENGLHYRRDETLREDWCHLRMGQSPHAMAVINNLVLGLLLRLGIKNVPQARRWYDAYPEEALQLILGNPT
jgi:predicted transposase YbfD/YdcC